MNIGYFLIGGNVGNRIASLDEAKILIEENIGRIINKSSIYETAAWGITDQPDFLNQVLIVETKQAPESCMQKILSIEKKMGRIRTIKNAARVIDIDILFFNDDIIKKPHLTIPHPEIQNRKFVLVPMNELSSQFIHPLLQTTVNNLLSACNDGLEVKKFTGI